MTIAERLVRIVRAPLPPSLRRRIRLFLFRWLDLAWALPSGVRLRVSSYGDWVVYNEIFVSGEYDEALRLAIDAKSPPADGNARLEILDLGANVGYFSLRAVDALRRSDRRDRRGARITAVECDAYSIGQLRARLLDENGLADQVRIIEGAVGERTGTATVFYVDEGHAHNTVQASPGAPSTAIPYVDLEPLFADVATIDLLKCDIEGAELLVLRSYPDLLRRTRVAIFELHANLCDVDECARLLAEYGFPHRSVLRDTPPTSTLCVWR